MPISRQKKEEVLQELKGNFSESTVTVFTDFQGMSVSQLNELRAKLHEKNARFTVAKKTLLRLALEEKGIEGIEAEKLEGEIAVAFGFGDIVDVPKIVYETFKEIEKPRILAGIVGGRAANAEEVLLLATLPSREVLYAKMVGSMAAPVSGFVNALRGNLLNFAYVMRAISERSE